MKMTTRALVSSVALGGATLAFALGSIDRAQAAAIVIYNTGVDGSNALLADGAPDTHYTLTSVPSGTTSVVSRTNPLAGAWVAPNTVSQWIGPATDASFTGAPGNYTYRTTFSLAGLQASTASITGRWSTDNTGVSILLNGVDISTLGSTPYTGGGFNAFTPFTIASGFNSGTNELLFTLNNAPGSPVLDNPTGLRVELAGVADPTAIPEPSDIMGTAIAFGSVVLLKRNLTKKKSISK
jgi:hypothetical protein